MSKILIGPTGNIIELDESSFSFETRVDVSLDYIISHISEDTKEEDFCELSTEFDFLLFQHRASAEHCFSVVGCKDGDIIIVRVSAKLATQANWDDFIKHLNEHQEEWQTSLDRMRQD